MVLTLWALSLRRGSPTLVGAAERFALRAKSSGFAHISSLWDEAHDQVAAGWLTGPVLLGGPTGLLKLSDGEANIKFMFAVVQMDKVRACDDFKYGRVNMACAARTPITLPTWDRIGQLCLDLRDTDRDWEFFKVDRQDAYKNLPINPGQESLCIVALRWPKGGERCGFFPLALLFGAAAAVLLCNFFSRIVAVLACSLFGLPVLNYFDDLGCTRAESIRDLLPVSSLPP